jgi:hypothetical protein
MQLSFWSGCEPFLSHSLEQGRIRKVWETTVLVAAWQGQNAQTVIVYRMMPVLVVSALSASEVINVWI